ncbi:Odorant receptor Or2 [Frankliniella fusca]|uniref:Odorant receptor n=1 Tax=Frankliniella fusca TaxID=407009 RepID=A0AAE1I0B0_9NEOP|nr:Odorant receptor Or2 [Frankliniella fusca]
MRDTYNSVSAFLAHYQKHFDKSIPKTFRERLWISCHGTGVKWAPLTGLVVLTLSSLDTIMTHTSLLDAGPSLRFVSGIWSCTAASFIWAYERERTLSMLRQFSRVAEQVEGGGAGGQPDPEIQETLQRAARRASRVVRGSEVWGCFVIVSILVPVALTGEPANPTWPPPTTRTAWWALFCLHFFSTIFLPIGLFPMTAFIMSLSNQCAALNQAVARLIQKANTPQQVRDAARLSSELNNAFSMLNSLFHDYMLHLLQTTLVLPLFAAYETLHGQFDLFLVVTIPINAGIFIPTCFAGQAVEDTSAAVADAAYNGSWLEGDHYSRVLRLQVMQRASRPQKLTGRQLGVINLALCQEALKKWFSFLNFMITTL